MTSGRATDQGGMSEGFETFPRLRMTVDRTNPMTVRIEGGQQEASGQEDEPEGVTGGRAPSSKTAAAARTVPILLFSRLSSPPALLRTVKVVPRLVLLRAAPAANDSSKG